MFTKLSILFTFCIIASQASFAQTKEQLFSRDSLPLLQELKQMSALDQKYRKGKMDSKSFALAETNDSMNTVRMIEIINTYGFPSTHRFARSKNTLLPHIILVHAPLRYADTLKQLLAVERRENRIAPNEYAHIQWHLDGRKELPKFEGVKVKKKGKKTVYKFTSY